MSPEMMDIEGMERLLNCAYNGVTFKNALLCALDWCNWYHCVNIHKDTDMYVDANGYIVDGYTKVSKTWMEKHGLDPATVNPHEQDWRERYKNVKGKDIKVKKVTDYSKYQSYTAVEDPTGNPKQHGWYEKSASSENYWKTLDTRVVADKTYYSLGGANPKKEGWYEKLVNATMILSDDTSVNQSKSYYTTKNGTKCAYFITEDTEYDKNKKYYRFTSGSAEMVDLPDYSDHYVRNVNFDDLLGLKEEPTLDFQKRPAMEEE